MTDLIMNLVDSYGFAENRKDDGQALYARNLVEVKIAELTAERDAYAAAADTMAAAHKVERDALKDEIAGWKADQQENMKNQCELVGQLQQALVERDALKDAARLALDALQSAVLEKELYLVKFDKAIRKLKAVL